VKTRLYLDHNAATPVDPRVMGALEGYLRRFIGNPSSVHGFGRDCRSQLSKSRDAIANYMNVRSDEIIFTSGGTEGANLAIRGIMQGRSKGHILTSSVEHSCVYNTIKWYEAIGCSATYLAPGPWGAVTVEDIKHALRPETQLIAIMAANNETGVKTDIAAIAALANEKGLPFVVDGVALLGKEEVRIPEGVSVMFFSGQKIHCVQGTGFCFVRKNVQLNPLITGAAQQFGRRGGTENMPGVVALAKAVSLLENELPEATTKMSQLREYFERSLQERIKGVLVNGSGPRVANTSNLCFCGVDGETLLMALDREGIAVAHGSACASGALEPSRVLTNMGFSAERVNSSIRFSISRMTTSEEVDRAIDAVERVVKKDIQYTT